jgi:hypothetical protein
MTFMDNEFSTVKLGIKELLKKEQIGVKELFNDLTLLHHKSTVE